MKRSALLLFMTFALLLVIAFPVLAVDELSGHDVRVLLSSSSSSRSYTVRIEAGEYLVLDDRGKEVGYIDTMQDVTFSYEEDRYWVEWEDDVVESRHPLTLYPDDTESQISLNGKTYRGGFKLMMNGDYCYGINVVDIELYLYGVVGREMGYNYHTEATKAQAVASRSYALANCSSDNVYYDVTATTASQVYGGCSAETDAIIQAVDDTRGQVLFYKKEIVPAFFSSNAGGYTENIENVWVSDTYPIVGVPSPYDSQAGRYSSYGASCYSWTVEYTTDDLVRLANSYGKVDIGSYRGIEVLQSYNGQTSVSGRAMQVTIYGTKNSVTATKDAIRTLLNLKSTFITVSDGSNGPVAGYVLDGNGQAEAWESFDALYAIGASEATMLANGDKTSFYVYSASGVQEVGKNSTSSQGIVISGKGYGHGVGLSQWGAIAMADAGYSWEEIITHYYCQDGIEIVAYY